MDQWKYVKYARRGLKHMQDGLRIQSAAEIQENDHAVAAVLCAGDDSLNYSEVASAEVSSGICRVLLQISDELNGFDFEDEEQVYQLRKALVQEARRIIRAKAKAVGIDRNQMDCTLSFVLVSKTDRLALSGNLGSSAVCMIRENEPVLISAPDPSGKLRVCSESAPAELQLRFFNLEDSTLTGFMLTTDGLKNEIYEDGSVLLKKDAEKYINALLADDPEAKLDSYIQKLTQSPDSSYQDDFCFAILSRGNMPVSFDSQTEWLCRCGTRNNISYQFCKSCGTEFASLYKGIDFSRYGGKDMLFRRLNSMPEQEKAFLDQCVKRSPDNVEIAQPSAKKQSPPAEFKTKKTGDVKHSKKHAETHAEPIMPQPESMDFSAQMPYQSPDAVPFANGDENDSWKNRKPGGLEKHERTIRLLAIIIGCLLAVFLIVAGLNLFSNKTDDNPQDNSSEVVNPGESEHSQGKKPITFH